MKPLYKLFLYALVIMPVWVEAQSKTEKVGTVEFARGAATVQQPGQAPRIVGKGTVFYKNDVFNTGNKSFAIIRLQDNSRMTLRPGTQFAVEYMRADKSSQDGAVLHLFKGGLRAVTGFISKTVGLKKKKANYHIKTPVATIGIRGTEFDARLCDEDCQAKSVVAKKNQKKSMLSNVGEVGRVAFAKGKIAARNSRGKNRALRAGSLVFAGDTLLSKENSHAVLAFKDNSRVTVASDSLFRIERYKYDDKNPTGSEALFNLIKGGLRMVTGMIGKSSPKKYNVKTPVATIGIRGTGFDLQCRGKCINRYYKGSVPDASGFLEKISSYFIKPVYASSPQGSGLFTHVWSGSIELQLANTSMLLNENQTAFLPNSQTQPLILPEVPAFMQKNQPPRPDKVDIPVTQTEAAPETDSQSGLYVSVDKGQVDVGDVSVNAGEVAFSGDAQAEAVKLDTVPDFIAQDPFPRPNEFNEAQFQSIPEMQRSGGKDVECELR